MRFQFDDFLLDEGTRQVRRGATDIHLSPKAFDLLAGLIQERPRALPKADLHARLWPTTFVSDASLAMLVTEVRAALGETARHPRYLRTVHRHGYAFQGNAREIAVTSGRDDASAAGRDRGTGAGYWLVTASQQLPLVEGDNIVGRDPEARIRLDSPSGCLVQSLSITKWNYR